MTFQVGDRVLRKADRRYGHVERVVIGEIIHLLSDGKVRVIWTYPSNQHRSVTRQSTITSSALIAATDEVVRQWTIEWQATQEQQMLMYFWRVVMLPGTRKAVEAYGTRRQVTHGLAL